MSDKPLIRVTEPRLGSVTHRGFHLFRLVLLASFAFWLVSYSGASSSLTRGLVTTGLLVCLWLSWFYARRWADIALVLELTQDSLGFSLMPKQAFKRIPLTEIASISYHLHLLVLDCRDGQSVQMHFPLKHRQYLARLRQALAERLPEVPQKAI